MTTDFVHKELFNLVCGDLIGEGAFRKVYAHRGDPTVVVKVEEGGRSFSNIIEWETWQQLQYMKLGEWLAPCLDISSAGSVLIQRRALPVRRGELPDRVPKIFTDLKIENWGMLDGKVVCVDYGNLIFPAPSATRKAEWWSKDDKR
jgi:hypothetical protein